MMMAVLLAAGAAFGGNGMGFGKQEIDVWASVYGTNDAATLNDVLSKLGTNEVSVGIDGGRWLIDDDVDVPSNVCLRVKRGSYFLLTNSATMSIRGELEAGNHCVFALASGGGDCLVDGTSGTFRFVTSNWFVNGIAHTNVDNDALELDRVRTIVGATETSPGNWLLDSYNTDAYMFYLFSGSEKLITNGSGNIALASYIGANPVDPGGWWNPATKMVTIPKTAIYGINFHARNNGCSAYLAMCKNNNPSNGYFTYGKMFPSGMSFSGKFVSQWSIYHTLTEGDSYAFYVTPDRALNSTSNWIDWVSIQIKYFGPDIGITNALVTEE